MTNRPRARRNRSLTKLLLISNRYPANSDDGASPFAADFVRRLKSNGVEVTVLTPYHDAPIFDVGYRAYRFRWGEEKRTIGSLPLWSPASWRKIGCYFRNGLRKADDLHQKIGFDFCLALWAMPAGWLAYRLHQKHALPYAVWCLGSDIHTYARLPFVQSLIVRVLRLSERIYSDGYELGYRAEELCGREVHFLPSLRKIESELRENLPTTEKIFVCPGRVEKSKGVFDLLEAFVAVAETIPEWTLYFIGDGSARSKLEARVSLLGLERRVKVTGFLSRDQLFWLMAQAAAIIIPTHADSLPLTFGEAIQLRRPVIVTDVGDLRRFTEKYQVGIVVPPGSPRHLAEALLLASKGGPAANGRYMDCGRELDIDLAADNFTRWLAGRMDSIRSAREAARC